MKDLRALAILATLGLMVMGGLLGWAAGPWMARQNYIVQVAERVWAEEAQGLEERTEQSDAFRTTGGVPLEQLFADAHEIRSKFKTGGLWLGCFIGLVLGLKGLSLVNEAQREDYEADTSECLACGRCFESCPLEHDRRGTIHPLDPRRPAQEDIVS